MRLAIFGTRHAQALLGSLGRLQRNPIATVLTLLVIGLALALPAALGLFITNAQTATGGFSHAVDMSVYLKSGVPLAKAQQLVNHAGPRRPRIVLDRQDAEIAPPLLGIGPQLAGIAPEAQAARRHMRRQAALRKQPRLAEAVIDARQEFQGFRKMPVVARVGPEQARPVRCE